MTAGRIERACQVARRFSHRLDAPNRVLVLERLFARRQSFELMVSAACWGVLPSGMLRHPLFLGWSWSFLLSWTL